jgi:hypothetical protein
MFTFNLCPKAYQSNSYVLMLKKTIPIVWDCKECIKGNIESRIGKSYANTNSLSI